MNPCPRIRPFLHFASRSFPLLALGILLIPTASAAPPDLTAPGVIAGINRSETYNLGATGLRGWIHITRTDGLTHGSNGTMTGESRQILVTVASAPADIVLAVDDVILGAMAASTGEVPPFSSDARKAFAAALTDAEKTDGGTLRVKRWRAGATQDVNIPITILGDYTATAPYSCPKSTLILANARNKLVADLKADPNFLWGDWKGSITALALLASVQPGDPDATIVEERLRTHARNLAAAGPQPGSLPIWTWAYNGLFLAEYYLLTGDANVLPGIQSYTLKLVESQSIYGTYGHGPAFPRTDGSGRRVATGYGPVNAAGIVANMAIFMGKKALVAGSQAVDPEIDTAIQRGSDYFKFYVNKGSIPYGEHEPGTNGHTSNGKDPMCAVFFGLQPDRTTETEYFARMAIATHNGREYGHTGQGFSYLWNALGANMGGALAVAEHLKPVRWHLDLSRRTDGSFAYDGAEQYGAGSTSGGTYLGASGYYGLNSTASYLLTYSLPLQRLYITGRRDTPANPPALILDASTIAEAIDAGNFKIDCPTFTTATLISSLSNYDPIVRHYAAIELGNRSATITPAELSTLRTMLTGPDANARMGASQALGILQDNTALPTIVSLLNDPDIWVRAKAAVAIRAYPSATASVHRDPMMTSFIANATDPDNIDWNDPLQLGNGKLSMAVFGHAVNDGTPGNDIAAYTINAPKESLLYPALRAGLQQPDSYVRTGATQFAKNRLSLTDTQAVYPSVAHAAAYDTPADRMWSNSSRADAITMLAALKITDAIPLALAMLESAPGFEWGEGGPRIAALNGLASYGDAARYTLPTLKGYLTQWNPSSGEYPVLVNTIETIENATTAPAQSPGLCVANSQVVTTTGSTAITLTGSSPRGSFTYLNVTQPAHGTLTGTAPNLTYTPNGGYAGPDSFTFQTTDTLTTSRVATVGIIVGTAGNGLKGEYFDNANFTDLKLTRTDAQVNFDWGTGSPHASIGADTFSVRWSGVLLVPQTGNYTFSALTSDGVRLYINGQLIIDRFVEQSTRWTDSTPVYLTAGQYAEVYMEYYENTGSAVAKLKWTRPEFAGANGNFIPQAYLFDGSGIGNRLAYAFPQSLSTNQNTALPILLNGSGGTLIYTVLNQPTNGTLSGTAPNLTYTPNSNFSGTDSFTFLVHNGTANSLPATVSISVQAGALTAFTWTNAVSGNWSDGTKWTPSLPAATGQPYYSLNFTTSGTYTATHNLNNGFQLNHLNTAGNVTINGTQSLSFVANGGSLPGFNQNGSNEVRVDHPMSLQATTTLGGSGGGKVILNGVISGAGGLIKNSPGDLEIGQNNSYSGGTTINAGTLTMTSSKHSALGSGPITLNGGTLLALSINAANPITVNGGKLWADGGWGGSWNGPVTLNGNLTVHTRYYDRVSLNGNITGTGGLIAEGDTSTYNSGNGVFLTGTNTYTGKTSVTAGMSLHCSHPAALGGGAVEISNGSKLDLNFTGTRSIASLTLDGVTKTPGTYGSTASNATHKNDTYFSGTGTVTVLEPTATSLNLSSGSSPAASGTSLTFTATVTGSSPTGNVQFFSGTNLLGTSALNGSFQATFTTDQLAIGLHSITARYVGDSGNGSSNSAAIAVEITPAAPASPTGLNATPGAANSSNISLSWNASGGATGYYVKRSTTSGGPYTILAYVTGNTCEDTTVTPGVSYYYVVSALNVVGESADSTQATALVTYIGVLTDTDPVIVPEAGTKTFQIKLSSAPAADVIVTTARSAGDTDITVQSGGSLTFTSTDWNTYKTVTLAAANDADALDGTATITCTPNNPNYATKVITAIENDTITTLTITNNGNGSTTPSGALTVLKGTATSISATPANAEYLFANWSVTSGSATFGNANAASTTVTLSGPATIRANFTAKPYTVTYYGNGSTSGTAPVDPDSPHPHSSTVTVLDNTGNLAKTGFTFVGWNTASNGSGTTYAPGATFTMPMSNVSLYPVWNQLPTTNAGPDQTIYVTANSWSPLILNPGLWLDAADSQTITASSGAISQWADRSGNNRHASQSTAANQPAYVASGLNSKGIVRFDGTSDLFTVDLDFLAGVSHSAFIVTKPTVFNNIYGAANGGQGTNSLHVGFNGSTYRMNYWGNDFGPIRSANFVSDAANIVNYAWTSGTGKEIFANGKSEGSNTDAGLIGTMSGGGQIGSTTGQGYFGGDIAEILIIPGTLAAQDREKIEAYLAHKWGLTAYLPTNHPYKSSPPAAPVAFSATTTLAGSATDPESNPLTTMWSQVSGPAAAEFASAAAMNSSVTFTQAGTYTLQLTANDGFGSVLDTVTINVQSLFPYWAWASGLSGGNAASGADPDNDGLTNFQEFAFGTLPDAAVRGPLEFVPGGEVTKSGLPVLRGYTPPQSEPPYQAVFGRRKNHAAAGITYTAEFSANLSYWTPSSTGATVLTGEGSHEIEVVAVPFPETVPLSEGGAQFPPQFFRIAIAPTS